jgi:hypothetical protein
MSELTTNIIYTQANHIIDYATTISPRLINQRENRHGDLRIRYDVNY